MLLILLLSVQSLCAGINSTENRQELLRMHYRTILDQVNQKSTQGDPIYSMAQSAFNDMALKNIPRFLHHIGVRRLLLKTGLCYLSGEDIIPHPEAIDVCFETYHIDARLKKV